MEWKRGLPVEPGYYWVSYPPDVNARIVWVDEGGGVEVSPVVDEPWYIIKRSLGDAWFMGPILPHVSQSPEHQVPWRYQSLAAVLDDVVNQLNTIIKNAYAVGLRVSWHVVKVGFEEGHEIDHQPHFDFKVFKEVVRE